MLGRDALVAIFSQLPESQMLSALQAGGIGISNDLIGGVGESLLGGEDSADNVWQKMRVDSPMAEKPAFETDYSKIFKGAEDGNQELSGQGGGLIESIFMPPGVNEEEQRGVGPRSIMEMTQGRMA